MIQSVMAWLSSMQTDAPEHRRKTQAAEVAICSDRVYIFTITR